MLRIENLSIIKECIRLIKERHNIDIEPYKLTPDDPLTYKLIASGHTAGLFQLEASNSAKSLCERIKPQTLEELSDLSSLNRPGPMSGGSTDEYIDNKNSKSDQYGLPAVIHNILKTTYGVMVYQEQLMEIVSTVAGFTLKEADNVRRAVGKKDAKKLTSYRQAFIDGCIKNGITSEYATHYWDHTIMPCGDYSFNKSHALTYSYLTYICAYLKAHYTIEFFTALMSVRSQTMQPKIWAAKAPTFVQDAKHYGIAVVFPNINKSGAGFYNDLDKIYFGFSSIKGIGPNAASKIVEARGNKPFESIADFMSRIDRSKINTGAFEKLVIGGCFDYMGYKRSDLIAAKEAMYEYFKIVAEREERIMLNAQRESENQHIASLIEIRDGIRTRAKKKSYELTVAEQEFLAANPRLMLHRQLKLPEVPAFPEITRHKKLSVPLSEVFSQGVALGCFLVHPATIIYPNATRLNAINTKGTYEIAGIVHELKTYNNNHGKTQYAVISDGTESIKIRVDKKIELKEHQLIWVKLLCGFSDETEETTLKCFKVYDIKIYGE